MTTIHLTETTTVTPEQFIAGLTEGSERLHDDRDRVVITATDSSVWGGASGEHLQVHAHAGRDDGRRPAGRP